MNRHTGRAITGIDHLRQSVADILSTPIASRVERRDYGSLLPELIDQPFNGATRVRLFAAVASALMRWEPRLRLARVRIQGGPEQGQATLELDGTYLPPSGPQQVLALRLPLHMRAAI